jgi:hypothetical protein
MKAIVRGLISQARLLSEKHVAASRLAIPTTTLSACQLHTSRATMSPVKRKAEKPVSLSKSKKAKINVPEYHLTPSRQDEFGESIWPARGEQIERARDIIKEW